MAVSWGATVPQQVEGVIRNHDVVGSSPTSSSSYFSGMTTQSTCTKPELVTIFNFSNGIYDFSPAGHPVR